MSIDECFRTFRAAQLLHHHAPNLAVLSPTSHSLAIEQNVLVSVNWLMDQKEKTNARAASEMCEQEEEERAVKRLKTATAATF